MATAPLLNDGAGALTKRNWEPSTGTVAKQTVRSATPPEGEASPRHQQAMSDRRRSSEQMLDSGEKMTQGTADEGRLTIMGQHRAKLGARADRGPRCNSSNRGEDGAGNRDSGGDADSDSSEDEGKVGGRR